MKKVFFLLIGLVIVITGMSQVKSTASLETAVLKSATDSLQYSAGAFIGAWLKNNSLEQYADQSLFKKGMQDCFKSKKVLTDSLIAKNIDRYLVKIAAENGKMQEQQLFAALRANANIGILPGGVCYEIISKGMGKIPGRTDSVIVNIKGQTTSGVLIADTYRDKRPATIAVNLLIKGLGDAVTTMPEGSKWKIYVPSAIAYGKDGLAGIIAPNTALMFEVELVKIKSAIAVQQGNK